MGRRRRYANRTESTASRNVTAQNNASQGTDWWQVIQRGTSIILALGAKALTIKLKNNDVKQIESHTGQPITTLEEIELHETLDDLNIQPDALNAADHASVAYALEAPTTGDTDQPMEPGMDYITEIERLADLRDRGIITEEDFNAKKAQLLNLQ